MSWKEKTLVSLRKEFVELAGQEGANFSDLCRRFSISRKTGYKWMKRFRQGGMEALEDRSRCPHSSPQRTSEAVEKRVLDMRMAHPTWGGRKIKARLEMLGEPAPASPNTVTAILRRHHQIDPEEAKKHRPYQRFQMEEPNQLWQMDFKGYFALPSGGYCHPFTALDDHSRFLLGLQACPNETYNTVQAQLTHIFRRYGLPQRMLMDNGPPWGDRATVPFTILGTWLIRLDIRISHSRPRHPQTIGKDERLHRTLKSELLKQVSLPDLASCQQAFDQWRYEYNFERPHEAVEMLPPATRYQPSQRPFPESLPPVWYDTGETVRKVDAAGKISFHNRAFRVGKAFRHQPVAIRPGAVDGDFDVFFCKQKVVQISFREHNP